MYRSKRKNQIRHAKKRFFERTGIDFTKEVNAIFVRKIRGQRGAILVERQSHRVSIWDVEYKDNIYRVVYDKKQDHIVTVLPFGCIDKMLYAVAGMPGMESTR